METKTGHAMATKTGHCHGDQDRSLSWRPRQVIAMATKTRSLPWRPRQVIAMETKTGHDGDQDQVIAMETKTGHYHGDQDRVIAMATKTGHLPWRPRQVIVMETKTGHCHDDKSPGQNLVVMLDCTWQIVFGPYCIKKGLKFYETLLSPWFLVQGTIIGKQSRHRNRKGRMRARASWPVKPCSGSPAGPRLRRMCEGGEGQGLCSATEWGIHPHCFHYPTPIMHLHPPPQCILAPVNFVIFQLKTFYFLLPIVTTSGERNT